MTPPRWVCTFPAVLVLAGLLPMRAEPGVEPSRLSLTSAVTWDAIGDLQHGTWKWSHGAFVYAFAAAHLSPTFYTFNPEPDGKLHDAPNSRN